VAVCPLPGTEVAFEKEVKYERFFAPFPIMNCLRVGRSDECPNHIHENCIHRRLVPVRERGTEYRLAPHQADNGAEDSRQRQERGKCLLEALTAGGRKGGQKDKSECDAEQHLPRIKLRGIARRNSCMVVTSNHPTSCALFL
jgi:hypothetical protein